MPKNLQKKIAITTGDLDGVGLEVTLKALAKVRKNSTIHYFIYLGTKTPKHLQALERKVINRHKNCLHLIRNSRSPAQWVEEAAKKCFSGEFQSLVTGPLSKETIINSGLSDIGHTDILKRITGSKNLHMGFVGEHFNVILATGHIALKNVSQHLTASALASAYASAKMLTAYLSPALAKKPMCLVGLNPHAGENGLLGDEELKTYSTFKNASVQPTRSESIVGPLAPDTAFVKSNWSKFSVYICAYHDQGLIPFKMIHGFKSGVHITLGLPFLRTSVDHGTAKDIFGKNQADPGSMYHAILLATKHSKGGSNEF